MDLKKLYHDVDKNYTEYEFAAREMRDYLNFMFGEDLIEDVYYSPSDGYVLLWENARVSSFDIDELEKLETQEEMIAYLHENEI